MGHIQKFKSNALEHGSKFKSVFENGRLKNLTNAAITIFVIIILTIKLNDIGWENVVEALPNSPLFYLISISLFFAPIVTETLVYGFMTRTNTFNQFTVFIRKYVYNKSVFSYAGEIFLITKLSKARDLGLKAAAVMVKDVALIRTFIANFWILLLLALALIFGNQGQLSILKGLSPSVLIGSIALCMGVTIVLFAFFRKLSKLAPAKRSIVALIYLGRSTIIAALQTFQWWIILPIVPLTTWFFLLIIQALAKKTPIGGDFVFVAAVLSLPGFPVSEAAMAGMLLASVATMQFLYLSVLIISSIFENVIKFKLANHSITNGVQYPFKNDRGRARDISRVLTK